MKKKPRITLSRLAGANERGELHRVLRVEGGGPNRPYRKEPCATCPWRKDAVGEFPAEAFRISAHTAYDMSTVMFGCHSSGTKKPATCAGFLLRGAAHNLSARAGRSLDYIKDDVKDGGIALFDSYREMAIANGVAPEDQILQRCRP